MAKTNEITSGTGKAVEAGGKPLAVFNINGKFYAIDAVCPHKGGPLAEGRLDTEAAGITCPWHGAAFMLETGEGIAGPCGSGVHAYKVRVADGNLEVDV